MFWFRLIMRMMTFTSMTRVNRLAVWFQGVWWFSMGYSKLRWSYPCPPFVRSVESLATCIAFRNRARLLSRVVNGAISSHVNPLWSSHSWVDSPSFLSRWSNDAWPCSIRSLAHVIFPSFAAINRAVNPSLFTWSTSKPSLRKWRVRISMATSFPTFAQYIKAVFPEKKSTWYVKLTNYTYTR